MFEGKEVLWVHTYTHVFFDVMLRVLNDARVHTKAYTNSS